MTQVFNLIRFYIGATQNGVNNRVQKHNSKFYGNNKYTAKADDWLLFLSIEAIDFAHALRIERFIKSQKSAKYIKNLMKYPELTEKVKHRCL